jgi:thiosulfate/3-mercaptopyruvate sulfurtransferase
MAPDRNEDHPAERYEAHPYAFAGPHWKTGGDILHYRDYLTYTHAFLYDDAVVPERYRGEVEPLDTTAGHIPGAKNHFFQWNVDEQGVFRTPEELRAKISATVGDVPADQIVCYCGSGVTACHNLLAFEHAGLTGAKLYAGSWSEWSSDPNRPIEKG